MVDVNNRLKGATATLVGKKPCRAASTENLFLSGYQTIDGVNFDVTAEAAGSNMRVLVKDQTDPTQNGIYLANSGLWTREKDFDGNTDFVKGTPVPVTDGTLYAKTVWHVTSSDPQSVGLDPITIALWPISASVFPSFTGDVTNNGFALTIAAKAVTTGKIADNAVTNAQMAGMPTGTIKSNILGVLGASADNTLSAILDALLGSTQGSVIYRDSNGAGGWKVLAPGTAGNVLQTNGPGNNPSWVSPGGFTFSNSAIHMMFGGI